MCFIRRARSGTSGQCPSVSEQKIVCTPPRNNVANFAMPSFAERMVHWYSVGGQRGQVFS